MITAIGLVVRRVFSWFQGLANSRPFFDPVADRFIWSMPVWLVAAWAGWTITAGKNALLAVLPALIVNVSLLSYARINSYTTYWLLGTTLVLIAVVQFDRREDEWRHNQVHFPTRKSRQIFGTALMYAFFLVGSSILLSSLSFQKIDEWTSKIFTPPTHSENNLVTSLGILPAATSTPDTFSPHRNPGLPRDFLIGSGPELARELVMSVELKNLPIISHALHSVPIYWRSFTYDIYTGQGWATSATTTRDYQADQQLLPDQSSGYILVQQVVRPVPGASGIIYAVGEPVSLNVSSTAAWRSSFDLFGILNERSGLYEINSLIPLIEESSLKASGMEYPDWISRRYLFLPPDVPDRVRELAIQLTAGEPTPYDRARAIEKYLRSYDYSIDVSRPSLNQDLVDFFLFTIRKGYCDYYASAMVVLARAAGIPARFATGYASGTFNLNSRRFMITQADAHSWAEIYITGIGWVPFEPTASQPLNAPPEVLELENPRNSVVHEEAPNTHRDNLLNSIGYVSFSLAILLCFIWVVIDDVHLRSLKSLPAAVEVYRRMRRYGQAMEVAIEPGATPYEYAIALTARVIDISGQGAATSTVQRLCHEIRSIFHQIVTLSYQSLVSEADSSVRITDQWKALRWRLRWMLLLNTWMSLRQFFIIRFISKFGKLFPAKNRSGFRDEK